MLLWIHPVCCPSREDGENIIAKNRGPFNFVSEPDNCLPSDMPLFNCNHCGQSIEADDAWAGASVACPSCEQAITVPGVAPAPRAPLGPRPPAPRRPSASRPRPVSSGTFEFPTGKVVGISFLVYLICCFFAPVRLAGADKPEDMAVLLNLWASTQYIIIASIFAFLLALPIAGIMAACRRGFGSSLSMTYGVILSIFTLLTVVGTVSPMLPSVKKHRELRAKEQAESEQKFIANLEEDMKQLGKGEYTPKASQPPDSSGGDGKSTVSKDLEKITGIYRSYLEESKARADEYAAAVEAAGLLTLLNPTRLANDSGFEDSARIIEKLRQIARDHKSQVTQAAREYPERYQNSDMSDAAKKAIGKFNQEAHSQSVKAVEEICDIEASSIERMNEIIELLKSRREFWTARDGRFVFKEDEDLKSFNQLLELIKDGETRQSEIQKNALERSEDAIKKLRELRPK